MHALSKCDEDASVDFQTDDGADASVFAHMGCRTGDPNDIMACKGLAGETCKKDFSGRGDSRPRPQAVPCKFGCARFSSKKGEHMNCSVDLNFQSGYRFEICDLSAMCHGLLGPVCAFQDPQAVSDPGENKPEPSRLPSIILLVVVFCSLCVAWCCLRLLKCNSVRAQHLDVKYVEVASITEGTTPDSPEVSCNEALALSPVQPKLIGQCFANTGHETKETSQEAPNRLGQRGDWV